MSEATATRRRTAGRLGVRRIRELVLQASVISVVVSVFLSVLTVHVDDRRGRREQKAAREESWRELLRGKAEFPRASLDGLDLSGAYASGAELGGASMKKTDLSNAVLNSARLDGVSADDARFRDAILDGAVMWSASLRRADLRDARLKRTDLRGADLRGADMRSTFLFRADLRSADLRGALLDDVDLRYVCFDESTKWSGSAPSSEPFCPAEEPPPSPLAGTQYSVDLTIGRSSGAPDDRLLYADEVTAARGSEVRFVIWFDNTGAVPLEAVAVVVNLPEGLRVKPGGISVKNSNHPEGYTYEDDALQAQGRQVNVRVGSYKPGSNMLLTVDVISELGCAQRASVLAFTTPRRFGSVSDGADLVGSCEQG